QPHPTIADNNNANNNNNNNAVELSRNNGPVFLHTRYTLSAVFLLSSALAA
ncbi:hypothetical protein C7212DRAFT_315823, partial [Tuber magnatum]